MKITGTILFFFLVLSLPAMAAEGRSATNNNGGIDTAELRLLLNSFAALGEGHITNALHDLELISLTKEAQSGEWEKMKGLLAEFARNNTTAAAAWFVLPDGSYYTVKKGLIGLNLRDRGYFPMLMAGREIRGYLVISKSTGRRTAIVAVPVKKNGRIIGAVGTSLSVAEISRIIDEEMGLPENIIFYALDRKGRTSLHRVSALLFAYPSDMGSKSLTKTVREMLASSHGVVTYDFYGKRTVVFKRFPVTGWVFAVGIVTGKSGLSSTELPPILSALEKETSAELDRMDQDVARLARNISERGLKTDQTRRMLGVLCRTYKYATDCSFVDRNGRMVIVEPEEYAGFEGSDISTQEQVMRLHESRKAVLSNAFRAVEGFYAVDLEYPVISPHGELEGSVSVLIRPESLFSHIITPALRGMPAEAFVMQKDGRILYDEDRGEVGRMLFEDPMYKQFPQLTAFGTLISKEKNGAGSYDFMQRGAKKVVKKDAHWTTVGLHGTEWRLVVMHVRGGQALHHDKGSEKSKGFSSDDALRILADNAEMKKAMSENNIEEIRDMFRNFYSVRRWLYSIQWLDSRGINRYGYPEENSLINVDTKTMKMPSSKPMLRALSGKKEITFDTPLVEGKRGTFFMVPVYEGKDYLGMIYTIRLKD